MRIKVYPDQSGENQFIQNVRRQLSCVEGVRVEGIPLDHVKLVLRLPYDMLNRSDCTVANWLENNVCSRSGKLSVPGCIKFFSLLLLFRLTTRRLIYVRHNLYPHRLKSRYSVFAKAYVDWVVSLVCDKVALSKHMVDQGYRYIPHPLYRFSSECSGSRDKGLLGEDYFVIFGTISRYKGIGKVVQAWTGQRRLLVVGKVADVGYLDELKALAKGRNVVIRGECVSDAEASRIISRSLGVILPHNSDEMIVSGAFFYAVALGTGTYAIRSSFYERLTKYQPFPGLELFDEPECLVKRLLHAPDGCFRHDRGLIRRCAQESFGDEVGVAA